MVKESKSKRMKECSKCGATENIAASGYICKDCKSKYNKHTYYNQTKTFDKISVQSILKDIIIMWESGHVTKSLFECIYIDSCKILGHSRKGYMLSQYRESKEG